MKIFAKKTVPTRKTLVFPLTMSLTNSEKSFSLFLSQYYQKKPNETNKNRLIPLLSKDERFANKLITGPLLKSPLVDNNPWHLESERKGQYIIITQHKTISPF